MAVRVEQRGEVDAVDAVVAPDHSPFLPGYDAPVGQAPPVGGNPGPAASRPAAPSHIIATATSATSIRLQWRDNAHDEIGFVLFRLGGGQTQLGANTTSFEWANLAVSQQHCFTVGVYNAAGRALEPFPPSSAADWSCADTPGCRPRHPPA